MKVTRWILNAVQKKITLFKKREINFRWKKGNLIFKKKKKILRSCPKQRVGSLPILKAILSTLTLIAGSGKRKTKKGRRKI